MKIRKQDFQTWLHEHDDEEKHLTQYPKSFDLNVIETLCFFLGNKFRARFAFPSTLHELENPCTRNGREFQ